MRVSYDRGDGTLRVGAGVVELPGPPLGVAEFEDTVLVALRGAGDAERNWSIPDSERGVAGFTRTGVHEWSRTADDMAADGEQVALHRFHDRCLCRVSSRGGGARWVELDPETGETLESHPGDRLRIQEECRTFGHEVAAVHTFGGVALVVQSPNEQGDHDVTAFDRDERVVWQRPLPWGSMREEDGRLVVQNEQGMLKTTVVEYDLRSGEPLKIARSVYDDPERLRTILPSGDHDLVEDYIQG